MTAAVILLAVVGGLALWVLVALVVGVPVGRLLRKVRRDTTTPDLRVSDRGKWTALLALSVLVSIGLAFATRGQVVTWDGVLTVGVPA